MQEKFSRTELLFGPLAMEKLHQSRVAVFGIGGVGGYAAESLVRTGIGSIDIFDGDVVSESNLNRQIVATVSAIGEPKTEVFKARALDINPLVKVNAHQVFYTKENADEFNLGDYDYIIDAIDMVSAKVELIKRADELGVPIISCMGAGNKTDPTKFEVADIYETSVCPLARVMRHELKNAGVKSLKVVYSKEKALHEIVHESDGKRPTVGSLVTVVATAGLLLANEVILDIAGRTK